LAAATSPAAAQCPDGSAPPCTRERKAPQPSVAILYFETPQGDTTLAYLADGLTESLIDQLSQAGVSVASRYQVRRYAHQATTDPASLGRALNVSTLVTGTLRGLGASLRVSIEMISAASGARLWGQQFERTSDDLLHLQVAIASAVADSIAGRLQPAQRKALGTAPTTLPAAYDHYLRGRYYLARRTGPAVGRAVQELAEASRLDPRSARLRAELGVAYSVYAAFGRSQDSLLQLAAAAADAALRLDSLSATAWLVRASTFYLSQTAERSRDLSRAAGAAQRSLSLDSLDPEAWHVYGEILMDAGADDAADSAYRRALALDPGRAVTLERLARLDQYRHRFEEALLLLDSALAVEPGFNEYGVQYRRFHVLLRLGRLADARQALEYAGVFATWLRPFVLLAANDSAAALAAADSIPEPSMPAVVAIAALGQTDRAMTMLEAVASPTLSTYKYLRLPEMDPLRGDPRFQRLVAASQPVGFVR